MALTWHVLGTIEVLIEFWFENFKEEDNVEGLCGRIILENTFKKLAERAWIGLMWPTLGTNREICGHGTELLGCAKCRELLD